MVLRQFWMHVMRLHSNICEQILVQCFEHVPALISKILVEGQIIGSIKNRNKEVIMAKNSLLSCAQTIWKYHLFRGIYGPAPPTPMINITMPEIYSLESGELVEGVCAAA